jgi:hypothetical protein
MIYMYSIRVVRNVQLRVDRSGTAAKLLMHMICEPAFLVFSYFYKLIIYDNMS